MARNALVEKALELAISAGRTPDRGSHSWWTDQWAALTRETSELTSDDPRMSPILHALAICDRVHKAADLDGFMKSAKSVRRLMCFVPGARVWWEGAVNHRLTMFGPALVEHVHCDDARLYVFVIWKGIGRWLSEAIVRNIEGPKS